jgi:hypothetical protein
MFYKTFAGERFAGDSPQTEEELRALVTATRFLTLPLEGKFHFVFQRRDLTQVQLTELFHRARPEIDVSFAFVDDVVVACPYATLSTKRQNILVSDDVDLCLKLTAFALTRDLALVTMGEKKFDQLMIC